MELQVHRSTAGMQQYVRRNQEATPQAEIVDIRIHKASRRGLVFRRVVATAARPAAGEMDVVLVWPGWTLRQQTPVGRGSMDSRQPVLRRLRAGAIGVLGAKAAARRRLDSSGGFSCAHNFFSLQIILRPAGRGPFVRRPAILCDRWPQETTGPYTRSWRAAARLPSRPFRQRAQFLL